MSIRWGSRLFSICWIRLNTGRGWWRGTAGPEWNLPVCLLFRCMEKYFCLSIKRQGRLKRPRWRRVTAIISWRPLKMAMKMPWSRWRLRILIFIRRLRAGWWRRISIRLWILVLCPAELSAISILFWGRLKILCWRKTGLPGRKSMIWCWNVMICISGLG